MSRRNTLSDVAKLAGVGKVTVSYVLNGRGAEARISNETSQRILAAARDLDYRPNALARMLLRKRTDTIAVVFQYADYFGATSTFISELMSGVCRGCVEAGFDVMLHTKGASDPLAEADALTDGRVDGALFLRDSDDQALNCVVARSFPVVLFFSRSDDPNVPYVDADNFTGGKMATNHFLDLGHTRIAMLRGGARSVASNDRHSGYRHSLEERGIAYDPSYVISLVSGNADTDGFIEMMRRPDRPTALLVWSDDVAFSVLRILADLGLKVPQDVSVIGFDSVPACENTSPPLTSIRQPISQIVEHATRLLVDQIKGESVLGRHQVVYPLSLDVRGSTGPVDPSLILR